MPVIGNIELCKCRQSMIGNELGVGAYPLWQRYPEIKIVVDNIVGEKYRDFLSQPILEADMEAKESYFCWYTPKPIEAPRVLLSLSGPERDRYTKILEETLAIYSSAIDTLQGTSSADLLEKSIRFIKYSEGWERFIFCFDDKVVAVVWGMLPRTGIDVYNFLVVRQLPYYTVSFDIGEHGTTSDKTQILLPNNEPPVVFKTSMLPKVTANEGWIFIGWDKDCSQNIVLDGDMVFRAMYNQQVVTPPQPIAPPPGPKQMHEVCFIDNGNLLDKLQIPHGEKLKESQIPRPSKKENMIFVGWDRNPLKSPIIEDVSFNARYRRLRVISPINPGDIIDDGNRKIAENRLNILLDDDSLEVQDFVDDFKRIYADEKYSVVYYDTFIKRIQIEIPPEERIEIRDHLIEKLPEKYNDKNVFIFEESVFKTNCRKKYSKQWHLDEIKAPQAWTVSEGSENVVVAIVDNGFNLEHNAFADKIVAPYNVFTGDSNVYECASSPHGTHVAGIAIAGRKKQKEISGVAPKCKFMPVQVADDKGIMPNMAILDGILYAAYKGADVINLSLGMDLSNCNASENQQRDIIANYYKGEERVWNKVFEITNEKKSVIVVSAGNDNLLAGIDPLQRSENVIVVAAVDKNKRKADFSNYAEHTDLSAPGVDIYSSVGNNGYEVMDGTSMAAPVVSGAVALLKSQNKQITTKEAKEKLQQTAIPVEGNIGKLIQLDSAIGVAALPWYKRFWLWLVGLFSGGCLRWLLWLLLAFLIFFLLWFLLTRCGGCSDHSCCSDRSACSDRSGCWHRPAAPIPDSLKNKPWIDKDPNVGHGGIYDTVNPYDTTRLRTPGEYEDILPPYEGMLPPVDTSNFVREPNRPTIIGNVLNILMENEDKSIMDFAKAFKEQYPDDKYKIVYYDDVVKRMQVQVPEEEREALRREIPGKFAPEYDLYVFDESLFETGYTPSDPEYKDANKTWYFNAIGAPAAWDITRGDEKLTVAVVDNSFNVSHPELSEKIVMPYNVWNHNSHLSIHEVDHGTHVSGTALALMDNGKGLCGIAPNCKFMPIQVADGNDVMTTTSVLDGVLYALYQGADVVNVSLGMEFNGRLPENVQRDLQNNFFKEEEMLWKEVSKIAERNNSIIVLAAGNDNMLAGINPMSRPNNIIVVSAVDKSGNAYQKAEFSNYGEYSSISAPGVDIYSCYKRDYEKMDGTSMAAPIVTGAVALMKSINKGITASQALCVMQSTGKALNGKIGNLLQLDAALKKVKSGNIDDCDNTPVPSTGDVQVLLSWNNYNDLDVACSDPSGNIVWYRNRRVPSGGQLEIDMNVDYPHSKTPIENIYWPHGKAPSGTYHVYMWVYKQHVASITDNPYEIKIVYGDSVKNLRGNIKKSDGKIEVFSFTLNGTSSSGGSTPGNNNSDVTQPDNGNENNSDDNSDLLRQRDDLQRQLENIQRQLEEINRRLNR